jgi:uncharacterized protein with PIN domain
MTLASGATINVDASEITAMLADETAGRLTISDQLITVTGAITVDNANLLGETTTGKVTATILTTESVTELATLNEDGGVNAFTIIISEADATSSTAAQLNTINEAVSASVVINLINVTALAGSSLADLGTLATAISNNEFTNAGGLTTIAVTDTTIDATTLAARITSYDSINGGDTTDMTLASGATINVDASEITAMLTDETAARLTIIDQKITVNSAGTISVDTANLLEATTSGVITASITTSETVDELQTLTGRVMLIRSLLQMEMLQLLQHQNSPRLMERQQLQLT